MRYHSKKRINKNELQLMKVSLDFNTKELANNFQLQYPSYLNIFNKK